MSERITKQIRTSMPGAVRLLLVVLLCLVPSAHGAKKKLKSKSTKTAKTAPSRPLQMKPVQKKMFTKLPPAPPPEPEVRNVVEIKRDQLNSDGIGYVEDRGRTQQLRLPASVSFRGGNLFSAEGRWVRVVHVSINSRQPAFRFGRREKYFNDNVLYPQEEALIEYSGLHLFPKPGALPSKAAVDAWMADLDSFLSLHRHDPVVIKQIESFVFKFSNQPPRGYLPGDQLWDTRRRFATWNQFFEYPLQYDLTGAALTVDGKPLDDIPLVVARDKIGSLPKLYPNVLRNIEYTFEGLRTVMFESNEAKGDDGLAEITAVRRSYLTLKLLKAGQELWEQMQASSKR